MRGWPECLQIKYLVHPISRKRNADSCREICWMKMCILYTIAMITSDTFKMSTCNSTIFYLTTHLTRSACHRGKHHSKHLCLRNVNSCKHSWAGMSSKRASDATHNKETTATPLLIICKFERNKSTIFVDRICIWPWQPSPTSKLMSICTENKFRLPPS